MKTQITIRCISLVTILLMMGINGCSQDHDNQPTSPGSGLNIPIGTPPNFVDNGDGTITETVTGLIWLKDVNCFDPLNWADALTAVRRLRTGMCRLLDGSRAGDWRLPDAAEIQHLMDYTQALPSLPANHPFSNFQNSVWWFWLAQIDASDPSFAWIAFFYDGSIVRSITDSLNSIWPVRGKRVLSATPRLVDNADGTVTDLVTGLIWLKDVNCFGLQIWRDAMITVETLGDGMCGLTDGSSAGDWRLPDVKELRSLVDYTRFDPALPGGHPFLSVSGDVFSDEYWTSTVYTPVAHAAWYVAFNAGSVSASDISASGRVWPVRSGY